MLYRAVRVGESEPGTRESVRVFFCIREILVFPQRARNSDSDLCGSSHCIILLPVWFRACRTLVGLLVHANKLKLEPPGHGEQTDNVLAESLNGTTLRRLSEHVLVFELEGHSKYVEPLVCEPRIEASLTKPQWLGVAQCLSQLPLQTGNPLIACSVE